MLDLLASTFLGAGTGIIGSIVGKLFSFVDYWVEEKKSEREHRRTLEILELQNKIGSEEHERELAISEADAASKLRVASYHHDTSIGFGDPWVVNLLRCVRPTLTFTLIVLVGIIYFNGPVMRNEIEAGVLFMCSSAVLWWWGDRTMRKRK